MQRPSPAASELRILINKTAVGRTGTQLILLTRQSQTMLDIRFPALSQRAPVFAINVGMDRVAIDTRALRRQT